MKLEELPKSTDAVRKFSNGNMLLTLWFDGSHCKSMEVVFDMLSGESVLFCCGRSKHYYHTQSEVRYGYDLSDVAANFKILPQEKIQILKRSIRHLNTKIKELVLNYLKLI